jgi:Na+/proline symporter
MAKNTLQVKFSFTLATLICLGISLTIAWIGVLLLADNPNLDPNNLLAHLVNKYGSYPGLKGIIAIGIMAVVMSTADSYINSGAILITNDICKSLNIKWVSDHTLSSSRIFSVVIGVGAFLLAFNSQSILDLTFLIWGSYMPIITAPLILAIIGFRMFFKLIDLILFIKF